jgi:ankyrin repeat protein
MRGLRLDRRRDAMPNRVGANRASIVPGNGAGSPVYLKLIGKQPGLQMPPTGPLKPEQINVMKLWIDQGADWPDALSGETTTSQADPSVLRMANALRNADRNEFKKLLRDNPDIANRKGPGGWTPLMYAAWYGDAEAVRLLLEKGADANARNDAGAAAIMYAVADLERTRILLEHGADPNARSGEGRTALLIAAGRTGASPVVKLLLEHGANASVQGSDGRTALAIAAA